MRSQWFFLVLRAYHFLTDNSLQSVDKDQQESRAVVEKPHDAVDVVKFDTYQNLQRHRAVLLAIARLLYGMHYAALHAECLNYCRYVTHNHMYSIQRN